MIKNAEQHAQEDKQRKNEVDKLNQAEHLVFQVEKFVNEQAGKISAEDKNKLESLKNELDKSVKNGNLSSIDNQMRDIESCLQSVTSKLYQHAAQGQQAGASRNPSATAQDFDPAENKQDNPANNDDNVIDADFEEID